MDETKDQVTIEGVFCPLPLVHGDRIVMGHGSGGKMSHDLIKKIFLPCFHNPILEEANDAGVFSVDEKSRYAFSTDMHTVIPLFFPGGDIGKLAVCGTVNDLAMVGARPLYLTVSFIIEEGFLVSELSRVVSSMAAAAKDADVQIIAGDTKVVQRGKADGVYVNTSGIGKIPYGLQISGSNAQPGDVVILSGEMGNHGVAILAARGQLGFDANILSDVAPLNHLVNSMITISQNIHVMRDPTRGGVGTTLNEIAHQSNVGILLYEDVLPVNPIVEAACEMLGFDPLYIANEGKLLAILPANEAEKVLDCMHKDIYGKNAVVIGEIQASHPGKVLIKTTLGSTRVVDMLAGEILPRIC